MEEEWRIVKSAPDTWPDAGFWTWIAPPQVRLWQAFLRGDAIEGEPVLADIPITHFAFEEPWTDDDHTAMSESDPESISFTYRRVFAGMELAILTEKRRRRAIGDTPPSQRSSGNGRRSARGTRTIPPSRRSAPHNGSR